MRGEEASDTRIREYLRWVRECRVRGGGGGRKGRMEVTETVEREEVVQRRERRDKETMQRRILITSRVI